MSISTLFRSFAVPGVLVLAVAGIEPSSHAQTAQQGEQQSGSAADWPRLFGPTGDGKSTATGILTHWPASGPPLVWQRPVGEGYAGAAIADGRLFIFDRHDDMARLTAVDAYTGGELWRREYPTFYEDYYGYSGGPRAAPVIADGRAFTFGVEGRLRAHDVVTGDLIWEVDTAEQFGVVQNFFGVGSSPVVEGDLLITMVGGSPADSPRIHSGDVASNGTAIVAFDTATGAVRYAVGDELAGYASPRITSIDGRRWGFVFARGGLLGFDPANGAIEFHFPWKAARLESVNASTPIVSGDTVFITEAYGLGGAALRVRPGGYEVLWQDDRRNQRLAVHFGNVIVHEGTLYGSHGLNSAAAELRAVDLASGAIRWSTPGLRWTTLLYVDGHLLVHGEDGRIHLIEATPEEYRVVASATPAAADAAPLLGWPSWAPPALADGLLYLRGKDRLIALELVAR